MSRPPDPSGGAEGSGDGGDGQADPHLISAARAGGVEHAATRALVRLGWLTGVPLILWTATGLFMVARPIDEVRGAHLRRDPPALPADLRPIAPRMDGGDVARVDLVMRADRRPVWIVRFADGGLRTVDPRTGTVLQRVAGDDARAIAIAALRAPALVRDVTRFAASDAPLELRRARPAWRVRFADGIHVYVDADSGEVLAVRSAQWRWFDLMWGLHIMDLQGRENSSHPLLIGFAALGLAGSLLGTALMFRRRRAAPRPISPP
ncbi:MULTISPECIES: PepSY domain-containing protein [unclassified Sphingomonas]|uniref:PepSY domain-containing protein n=1 Tax=unclassified Sphingomonas TaxID=196159 RepID=UPI001E38B5C0|nr:MULTISPECIES: PepSY domain-containing protein [unclassified Sphingomonas]